MLSLGLMTHPSSARMCARGTDYQVIISLNAVRAAGTQKELDKLARSGLKFSDIFEVGEATGSPPACPRGFAPANTASAINQARAARVGYGTRRNISSCEQKV